MAERTKITCPGCGRVYASQVRGDDTRCPGCGRSVYVRLDGTYRGQALPALAAAAVDVAPEAFGELDEDLVDVDLEAELEPAVAAAAGEDLEDARGAAGGGLRDPVLWLLGGACAVGVGLLVWEDRRQRRGASSPAPAAAGPVYGGFGLP